MSRRGGNGDRLLVHGKDWTTAADVERVLEEEDAYRGHPATGRGPCPATCGGARYPGPRRGT
eukprot:gene10621-960_t